jgi:hypothetical protein
MDGPYFVRLEQQREDTWKLSGCRNEYVEFTASISCREFINSLRDTVNRVLRECEKRGWQGSDIDALASAVKVTSAWHHDA